MWVSNGCHVCAFVVVSPRSGSDDCRACQAPYIEQVNNTNCFRDKFRIVKANTSETKSVLSFT